MFYGYLKPAGFITFKRGTLIISFIYLYIEKSEILKSGLFLFPDHVAHIIRPRDSKPDIVPGAAPRSATGHARPVLRLDTALDGLAGRAAAARSAPRRHRPPEAAPAGARPPR